MKKNILGLAMVLVLIFAGVSHAVLWDRGNYMIYDDDRNITWYDYSYLAANWDAGNTWAKNLSVTWNGITISDWRLPKTANKDGSGICTGYVCKKSDLGHLFFMELKNKAMYDALGNANDVFGLIKKAPFRRLKNSGYWSGPKDIPWYNLGGQYAFAMNTGYQGIAARMSQLYVIAVRTGDVALLTTSTMEEPPPDEEPLPLGGEDRDADIWLLPSDFE